MYISFVEIYWCNLFNSFDLVEFCLVNFFKGYSVEYMIQYLMELPLLGLAKTINKQCGLTNYPLLLYNFKY